MPAENHEKRVALFIDAENLIRPLENKLERLNLESIIRRVREQGVLMLSRAYGDWGYLPCRDYIREFNSFGIEMSQLHSDQRGKNTADMQLTVDVLEHCRSSISAQAIVLASGDRDFVPLVQALRRQGKEVICICIDEAASSVLQQICDVYIAYDTLKLLPQKIAEQPAAPGTAVAPVEEDVATLLEKERGKAFQTLADAIIAVKRRGGPAIGGHVNTVMRQLMPSFDLITLGFNSFKEFVEEGYKRKLVLIVKPESGIGDFSLDVPSAEAKPKPQLGQGLNYLTIEESVKSYRILLERKRVAWIPWKFREPIVRHLWETLLARGDSGMLGDDMVDMLIDFAYEREWNISESQIVKLLYTLNIAYCFKIDGVAKRVNDVLSSYLTTAVDDVDQVLEFMHLTYLKGLRFEDHACILKPEAVAELLFDARTPEFVTTAQQLIYDCYTWR
ncbi:MAG: NYN domain-containing protein [Calditrichaeota bacterium]|nr:NYN domain-containing protein [Calditrichota bacterium]